MDGPGGHMLSDISQTQMDNYMIPLRYMRNLK